jgi:hypothetical protein
MGKHCLTSHLCINSQFGQLRSSIGKKSAHRLRFAPELLFMIFAWSLSLNIWPQFTAMLQKLPRSPWRWRRGAFEGHSGCTVSSHISLEVVMSYFQLR